MKSHEYAQKLKETAEYLLSKPEFKVSYTTIYFGHYWDKDEFLTAVRALGAGTKKYSDADLTFSPASPSPIYLSINRSTVCKLVRQAEYECELLLSQEEEAEIGVS
jgi:hypothetical protein